MEQYIFLEYYNNRWHLKGLCDMQTIKIAKAEYGDEWQVKRCRKNEMILSEQELNSDYPVLYESFKSVNK